MLAFLDLETTHLKPSQGSILEIAYVITDDQLNMMASYTQNVRPLPGLDQMQDEVVLDMHTASGLLAEIAAGDCMRRYEAEADAIGWLPQLPDGERFTLVGNSIEFDASWMAEHMPKLFQKFDRRLLNVTSLNGFARLFAAPGLYCGRPIADPKKKHRARYDAQQSLETLRYYRDAFGLGSWRVDDGTLLVNESPRFEIETKNLLGFWKGHSCQRGKGL